MNSITPKQKELFAVFFTTMVHMHRLINQKSHVSLEDKIATVLQMQALRYITEKKGASIGDVAKELSLSSSSIAQLTDRLVLAGWVIKEHDKMDRRIVHLFVTKMGEKELISLKEKQEERMGKILSLLPISDLETLIGIQKKLISQLESNL